MVNEAVDDALLRWIPLVPFLAAVLQGVARGLMRRSVARSLVVAVACGAVLASFALTCMALASLIGLEGEGGMLVDTVYTWIGAGIGDAAFSADVAFRFDALSAVMCMVITGVGFLIHVYSVGYMGPDQRDDGGLQRYFAYLNLFIASMLVLVLADNLVLLFLGWEGVGLCSYLLIGFWYSDSENARAGTKAFVVNRIGDFGFLVGILVLFWALSALGTPTVSFRGIEAAAPRLIDMVLALPSWLGGGEILLVNLVGLLFFLGACGKSAQLPLYVWLPDAMAGPTPVSALIHAATMVTAGVYLVCRLSFLYVEAPLASAVMAWTGAITALFAATAAIAQSDIKKVLAYSTVSQLGYMFLAAGCGAYTAAMFHVVTHAFFKALLFLGAGAIILALHHEQDLAKMGGLKKKLPKTKWVMLIGAMAIAGVPGLSGFFSKDEILLAAHSSELPGHEALFGIALVTGLLTAFYMFRMYILAFEGPSRVDPAIRSRLDEPDNVMMVPLYTLAVLALFGGFVGLPQFWGDMMSLEGSDSLANFLGTVLAAGPQHEIARSEEWFLIARAVLASVVGIFAAWWLYKKRPAWPAKMAESLAGLHAMLANAYWVDLFYDRAIVRPLLFVSDRALYRGIDAGLIDGIGVNGTAQAVRMLAAHGLKYLQSGLAQSYLLFMIVGVLAIVSYLVG